MTIYDSLMKQAAEWEHEVSSEPIELDTIWTQENCLSWDCHRCQLEAIAKQVCAEAITNAESHSVGVHPVILMRHVRNIIGGPK